MKEFNTTGPCVPSKHYMVDLTERVTQIKMMVDAGKYFVINRARQYGKTTTLEALATALMTDHYVVAMDFQDFGEETFTDANSFCRDFLSVFCELLEMQVSKENTDLQAALLNLAALSEDVNTPIRLFTMFRALREAWNATEKPMVLIIDEVDSATNNQLFLDFLAALRSQYIKREKNDSYRTFKSVILSGVTDVRHLKGKIRDEDQHKVNSPWNIAADFDVDMSLSETGIKGMLDEYEADHNTGMNTTDAAAFIRAYTNGYPFLVGRICQLVDTRVSIKMPSAEAWSRVGIDEAVKIILDEDNTLFQSLVAKLNNSPELRESLRSILMEGARIAFNSQQDAIVQMQMYGFIRNDGGTVRIDNRIFETMLYNLYLSDEELKSNAFSKAGELARNIFVDGGKLNMRLILERFIQTYFQVFGPLRDRFREKDGRELFLLYLKPIINGTGNYYIEAQTRDQTRTDVVVDYLGCQYIVELKIWRGPRYNAAGEKQIAEYLDYFDLTTGYMLSFNFNKHKEPGVHRVEVGDKLLYEGVV